METNYGAISAFRLQEQRQATARANQDDVSSKNFVCQANCEISGTGATTVTVDFPIKYLDPPYISPGGYLKDGQNAQLATFPELDVHVIKWGVESRPPNSLFYTGATLSIKTYGIEDQVMVVQVQFNGKGLSTPSTYTSGLDETI